MAEIKAVAVIGAGSLGRSIAYAAALAGYRTIVEDILPASLRRVESEFRGYLNRVIAQGRLTGPEADAALVRLQYAGSVEEAARHADLVIEAVPDEMESKLEIFTLLDKISKPHTILACTTAMFSVTEIASITYRAGKILGMRFSNPAYAMERLEIVRATETDDETIAACAEVGRRMSRNVVVTEEPKPSK
jgi:3-hydroxybutyryl-CoA dehydrogenase